MLFSAAECVFFLLRYKYRMSEYVYSNFHVLSVGTGLVGMRVPLVAVQVSCLLQSYAKFRRGRAQCWSNGQQPGSGEPGRRDRLALEPQLLLWMNQ